MMGLGQRKAAATDRRKWPRRPVGLGGKLVVGGSPIDCTIVDISEGGAKVELSADVILPASFYLRGHTGLVTQACLVWRSRRTIGVQFVGPWTTPKDVADPAVKAALG